MVRAGLSFEWELSINYKTTDAEFRQPESFIIRKKKEETSKTGCPSP